MICREPRTFTRKHRSERYQELIQIGAAAIADLGSVQAVSRLVIAKRAHVSKALVSHYFGDMESARYMFVDHGIANGCPRVALAALSERHKLASDIGEDLREAACKLILEAPQ